MYYVIFNESFQSNLYGSSASTKIMVCKFNLPCQRSSIIVAPSFPLYPSKPLQRQILKILKIHPVKRRCNSWIGELATAVSYCKSELPDKFAIPMKAFARPDGTPALLNTVEEK